MRQPSFLLATLLLLSCCWVNASEPTKLIDEQRRAAIAAKVPPATSEDVIAVGNGELYQVKIDGGTFVYVTRDGRYMIAGDLFDLDSKTNLSEEKRAYARRKELTGVADEQAIVFDAPGNVKHTITVFTDPDCPYCQKFHSELPQLTALGIRVRYLAFPRTGPRSDSWNKTQTVWCAEDRRAALTQAMLGQSVSSRQCDSPVMQQFELGKRIAVRGTPMIVAESGAVLGGYMPAQMLAQKLDEVDHSKNGGDLREERKTK